MGTRGPGALLVGAAVGTGRGEWAESVWAWRISLESHYELEGVLGIKSPVGPENPVVMGFTCPLHPARSQLKARRWMRLLLVWVHCDVVVVERVI